MKNQININNITDNEPKINIPKLKEEKTEKSFIDTIIDFFKPTKSENIKLNTNDELSNIRGGYIKCNCPKTHSKFYCDNIYEIIGMLKGNQDIDSEKSKKLYEGLLHICDRNLDANGENILQIKKDLHRTFPSSTIMKSKHIQNRLKNVLRAFSNYEPNVKYFQGMNFIVGFFLYHCDEYIAFWLFATLFEDYDLGSIFMKDFPGLKLHVKRVEIILQKEYVDIWKIFVKFGVKVEIFMVEWVFSLFSSLIPLDLQMDFYKGFFSQGWIFFYKMCISSILNLNGGYFEVDEIYMALKCGKNNEKMKEEDIKENWKKIIQNAYSLKIKTDVMNINK